MVKFGKYLLKNEVPEWKTQYLDYKGLKKLLKKIAAKYKESSEGYRLLAQTGSKWAQSQLEKEEANLQAASLILEDRKTRTHGNLGDETAPIDFEDFVPSSIPAQVEERLLCRELQADLYKIEGFYRKQEEFFVAQVNALAQQSQRLNSEQSSTLNEISVGTLRNVNAERPKLNRAKTFSQIAQQKQARRFKLQAIKRICKEVRRGLDLLNNYQILNYTAFVKIMKKHDKTSRWKAKDLVLTLVDKAYFHTSKVVEVLISQVESIYVKLFAAGDRKKGLQALRVIKHHLSHWVTFGVGLLLGGSFCILVAIAFTLALQPGYENSDYFTAAFPVFRFLSFIIIHCWGWGILTVIYTVTRLNYGFIFEADPRTQLKPAQIFMFCAICTFIFLLGFFLYLISWAALNAGRSTPIPPEYYHLLLFVITVGIFVMPFDWIYRPTRYFIIKTLLKVVTAPLWTVVFRDFFFADQLCSLVRVFLDLFYSVCFYTTGSFLHNEVSTCSEKGLTAQWVIAFLPYFWRLLQCFRRWHDSGHWFPNVPNALKYFASILVTFTNLGYSTYHTSAWLGAWIAVAVCSTFYSYAWDIKMDWGFFEPNIRATFSGTPVRNYIYYWAAISNFILRICWVLTISPTSYGSLRRDYFLFLIGCLEILRRTQWNYFRLLNEHMNNCGQYRAVNIVPIPIEGEGEVAAPPLANASHPDRSPDEDLSPTAFFTKPTGLNEEGRSERTVTLIHPPSSTAASTTSSVSSITIPATTPRTVTFQTVEESDSE